MVVPLVYILFHEQLKSSFNKWHKYFLHMLLKMKVTLQRNIQTNINRLVGNIRRIVIPMGINCAPFVADLFL